MAFVHLLRHQVAVQRLNIMLKIYFYILATESIDNVWDQYFQHSIKDSMQQKRVEGKKILI